MLATILRFVRRHFRGRVHHARVLLSISTRPYYLLPLGRACAQSRTLSRSAHMKDHSSSRWLGGIQPVIIFKYSRSKRSDSQLMCFCLIYLDRSGSLGNRHRRSHSGPLRPLLCLFFLDCVLQSAFANARSTLCMHCRSQSLRSLVATTLIGRG